MKANSKEAFKVNITSKALVSTVIALALVISGLSLLGMNVSDDAEASGIICVVSGHVTDDEGNGINGATVVTRTFDASDNPHWHNTTTQDDAQGDPGLYQVTYSQIPTPEYAPGKTIDVWVTTDTRQGHNSSVMPPTNVSQLNINVTMDWYFKPESTGAPSGMPDFDQKQFVDPAMDGPTAVADCFWWYDASHSAYDDLVTTSDPATLINDLHTTLGNDPTTGIDPDTMQAGIRDWINATWPTTPLLYEHTEWQPNFTFLEDELERCQDVMLLLGFWYNDSGDWTRVGGHWVTMAGVNSVTETIAVSDPYFDWNGTDMGPGRTLPEGHNCSAHGATNHNNPANVSQDYYAVLDGSESPGGQLWLPDYPAAADPVYFEGMNVPSNFTADSAPWDGVSTIHTEIETAVMVSPLEVPSIDVEKTVWDGGSWVEYVEEDVGNTVTFNITVENDGLNVNTSYVHITDVLPTGLSYVSGSATVNPTSVSGQTIEWNLTTPMAQNDVRYIEFEATVDDTGFNMTNDVDVEALCVMTTGSVVKTDMDNATVFGNPIPDMDVYKYVWDEDSGQWTGHAYVRNGTDADFLLAIHNNGLGTYNLTDISIVDFLPDDLVLNCSNPAPDAIETVTGGQNLKWWYYNTSGPQPQTVMSQDFDNVDIGWTIENQTRGDPWVIAGGEATVEESSGEQDEWLISPVIDCTGQTGTTLKFYSDFYNSTSSGDSYGEVWGSTDGGSTWTQLLAHYGDHTGIQEIDISSWADGESNVKIAFRFYSTDGTSEFDDWTVDDFWVGTLTQATIGSEDFAGGVPGMWTVTDVDGNGNTWAADAGMLNVTCTASGEEDELITQSYDCSAYDIVTLEFYTLLDGYADEEVEISTDGGTTWTEIDDLSYYYDSGTVMSYDISSYAAGESDVQIMFRYYESYYSGGTQYWAIDNFYLNGTSITSTAYENDFSTFPPPGWYNQIYSGTGEWEAYDYYYYAPPNSTGFYAYADDSSGVDYDVGLLSPSMDLSSYASYGDITLEFDSKFDYWGPSDYAEVRTYSAGSLEETLATYTADHDCHQTLTFDASGYTDPSDVQIEFYYYDGLSYAEEWAIDNVEIIGLAPPAPLSYPEGLPNGEWLNITFSATAVGCSMAEPMVNVTNELDVEASATITGDTLTGSDTADVTEFLDMNPPTTTKTLVGPAVDANQSGPSGCNYTVSLWDSWGDGWNGGTLDVYVNGDIVHSGLTVTTAQGHGPVTAEIPVMPGDEIFFDYTYGSYATENYYEIFDCSGASVYNMSCGSSDTAYDYTVNVPSARGHRLDLLDEGFEGTFPPTGWTIIQHSGTGTWEQWDYDDYHTCEPPGSGDYYALANSDDNPSDIFDVGLFTPSLDCSNTNEVTLTYARDYQNYAGYDEAAVNVYSGGTGSANFEEQIWWSDSDDPYGGVTASHTFDPAGYSDPSDVYIEFLYDTNGNDWLWGLAIDDVHVEKELPQVPPADEKWYITSSTDLWFHAEDDISGVQYINITHWYDANDDGSDVQPGETTVFNVVDNGGMDDNPAVGVIDYNMTLADEGLHQVRYYSVDMIGNTENTTVEEDYVDDTPPETEISYEGPYWNDAGTHWVSCSTDIILTPNDLPENYHVDSSTTYYRYWNQFTGWTDWMNATGGGGGGGDQYSFNFDSNDGGWTPWADWDPVGDWEWTDDYDVNDYQGTHDPPTAAHSGDGLWGTVLYNEYTNSGGETYLSKTFDFSGFSSLTMNFWYWSDLFGSWDYGYVEVNGNEVWSVDDYPGTAWEEATINLDSYAGQSDVNVTFGMHATTVVAYAGLYIDDVSFTQAARDRVATISLPDDGLYYIEYYSTDALGNNETPLNNQTLIADCTPPGIDKEIGQPQYYDSDDDKMYVNSSTPFTITAYEQSPAGPQIEFYLEDFEAGTGGWTTVDGDGGGYTWERVDTDVSGCDAGGASGWRMGIDDDDNNDDNVNDQLISPVIDCTGRENVLLDFDGDFEDFGGHGEFWVNVSADGGSTWTNVLYQTEDLDPAGYGTGFNQDPRLPLDISAYADNNPNFVVKFTYSDTDETGASGWAWGAQVDNIRLVEQPAISGVTSGFNTSEYRVWYNGHWSDWTDIGSGAVIQPFDRQCTHYLEIRAFDNVGNEYVRNQTYYVDNAGPLMNVTVGDPFCYGTHVTSDTKITVDASDSGEFLGEGRDIFYGYMAYDPGSTIPEGPIEFPSDDPGAVTSIAPTSSNYFIAGACWADGTWYGVEYGGYGDNNLWTIDPSTGDMTVVGSYGVSNLNGLAYDPSTQTMYGASGESLYTVDPSSGATTYVGDFNTGYTDVMIGIACDSSGNMYGVDIGTSYNNRVWAIDTATGDATLIGQTGLDLYYAQDVAYDKDSDILYLAGYTYSARDKETQTETPIDALAPEPRDTNRAGGLYTVSTADGSTTLIGSFINSAEVTGFAIPYTGGGQGPDPIPGCDSGVQNLEYRIWYQGSWSNWVSYPGYPALLGEEDRSLPAGSDLIDELNTIGNNLPTIEDETAIEVDAKAEPTTGEPTRAGNVLFEQVPHTPSQSWSFGTSDYNMGYKIYENFWDVAGSTRSVTWYGLTLYYSGGWYPGDPAGMNFYVDFYSDPASDTSPSDLVQSFDLSPGDITVTDTGLDYAGFSMYKFDATLPSTVTLNEGWIAVQSHDDADGDTFMWASSPDGDGYSYQGGSGPTYDDRAFTLYGAPPGITLDGECTHYVEVKATDNLGQTRTINNTYKVDNSPPQTTTSPDITSKNPSPGTPITISAVDQGACPVGGYTIYYQWKDQPVQHGDVNSSVTLTAPTPGTWTITYWAVDCLGNEEQHHTVEFRVMPDEQITDLLAFDGPAEKVDDHWEITPDTKVMFDMQAAAPLGIAEIWYRIDNGTGITGEFTKYTGPFTMPTGTHSLYYYGVDNVGRFTPTARTIFVVSAVNQAPTTTCTLNPESPNGDNGWYTSDVTVTLTAADPEGDTITTYYKVDDGEWTEYTGPFTITEHEEHTIYYRSTDSRDNQESTSTKTLKIDQDAPEITVHKPATGNLYLFNRAVMPLPGKSTVIVGKIDVEVSVSDPATSGIAGATLSFNGEVKKTFTDHTSWTLDEFAIGPKTITVEATDGAGNKATENIEVWLLNL